MGLLDRRKSHGGTEEQGFGYLKKTGMDSGKGSFILLEVNCCSMILKQRNPVLGVSPTSEFWLTRLIAGQDKHNYTKPIY